MYKYFLSPTVTSAAPAVSRNVRKHPKRLRHSRGRSASESENIVKPKISNEYDYKRETNDVHRRDAHGQYLMFIREKYTLNASDEYMKETTAISQMIQEMETDEQAAQALVTTGLIDWFQDLKAKNAAFLQKMNERTEAQAGQQKGIVREKRLAAEGWINDAIRFWNQQRSGSTRISQTRTSDGSKPPTIYSLNGTRRDTLQRGINIVDGKAYLVK